MTRPKLNEQEIERKLRSTKAPQPPSHLLDRLKADIPDRITLSSPDAERRSPRLWRNSWAVAASVLALVGMSYVMVRTIESPDIQQSAPLATRTSAEVHDFAEEAMAPRPQAVAPAPEASSAADLSLPSPAAPVERDALALPARASRPQPTAMPALREDAPRKAAADGFSDQRAVNENEAGGVVGVVMAEAAGPAGERIAMEPAPPPRTVTVRAPAPQVASGADTVETTGAAPVAQGRTRLFRKEEAKSGGGGQFVEASADPSSTFGLRVGDESWGVVRAALLNGRLPERSRIREEEIVNHFDYGEVVERRGVSLSPEVAPAPFGGARQYVVRIAVRTPARPDPAATNAIGYVQFNPEVVEAYRLVGYERASAGGEAAPRVNLPARYELTVLYEVRLAAAPAGERLGTAYLEYSDAAKGNMVVTTDITSSRFAPSWDAASPSLRLASLAAKWAELLKGSPFARGVEPREIMIRAQKLSAEFAGDTEVADFMALTAATVRLME